MKPPSGPKKQTQTKLVLSAVEWANFFKGQNHLPENLDTPLDEERSLFSCNLYRIIYTYP